MFFTTGKSVEVFVIPPDSSQLVPNITLPIPEGGRLVAAGLPFRLV
mgnify:CR=1 FL=1